jgi:hypothetical protein
MLALRGNALAQAAAVMPLSSSFSVVDFSGLVDRRFHESCFMTGRWMDGWMEQNEQTCKQR